MRGMPRHAMIPPSRPGAALFAAVVLGLALVGCSSDDAPSAGGTESVEASSTVPATEPTAGAPEETAASTAPETVDPEVEVEVTTGSTPAPPTVPEVGVPGLDSEEVVCRAWSRFAGSFQVVAVAWSFGDPATAAALEVAAAPVVVGAVDELLTNWPSEPDELAAERELVAEDFLGPTARRAEGVLQELLAAGATEADLTMLAEGWLAALAARDPSEPVLPVSWPPELDALVTTAAEAVVAALPPVPQDPSLVVEAEVPATEAFLAGCPDQGALAGTEVG